MDDPFLVRGLHSFGDLAADFQSFLNRQRPFGDALRQRFTLNQFQNKEAFSSSFLQP